MADEFDVWITRIKAVEREYFAARFAIDRTLGHVRKDSTLLTGSLKVREIERAAERLEGTYTIRLFGEFETALRLFLRKIRRRQPPSKTRDLLESVAALRGIPIDHLGDAHAVRNYRNVLVHEREEDAEPMMISHARARLCVYFSFLPRDW